MGGGGMMPSSPFPTTNPPVQPVNFSSVFGTPPSNVDETRNSGTNDPVNVTNNPNVDDAVEAPVGDAEIEEAKKKGRMVTEGSLFNVNRLVHVY